MCLFNNKVGVKNQPQINISFFADKSASASAEKYNFPFLYDFAYSDIRLSDFKRSGANEPFGLLFSEREYFG